MKIKEFQNQFEQIAPSAVAWDRDNVGLLIGRENDTIRNILVALDLTMDVAKEAKQKNVNFIVTHHPLLFHPLKKITEPSRVGELVLYLTKHKINVFAAHTNLDSVNWGVNFSLAKTLGLTDVKVLSPMKQSLTSIVVFVPEGHTERVAEAMHEAGAGMFSTYDHCSFRGEGTGTFRGMNDAKPFLGTVGVLERAKETRLEMLVENWKIGSVLLAMLKAHPYEEVAYQLHPLENKNTEYGLGAIGNLKNGIAQKDFLTLVKRKLKVKALRFSGNARTIKRVAVCGGSGSEYINDAIALHADAMVTADLKYHTFQDAEEKILLIDAGHYETERIILPVLADKIIEMFKRNNHSEKIFITQHSTNPVHIF
ncbi:MAG: Nif3-like dinuclear metal center hexameric protein [Bacteroidota bacterium]